ncbi:hypothetical protein Tco_0584361, partial [Tanacetum coccineum]
LEEVEDVILRDKLSNVYLLISKIEALNDNPTLFYFSDNSFSDHTEETRSGSTTTHANYSLPEYDSFLFEIEPDQEGMISIDNSNNTLLEFPEFESFHFDPSVFRPPPKPPDVEKCFEPKAGFNPTIFEASRVRLICSVLLELLILCVKLVWGNPISFRLID